MKYEQLAVKFKSGDVAEKFKDISKNARRILESSQQVIMLSMLSFIHFIRISRSQQIHLLSMIEVLVASIDFRFQ